VSEVRIFPGALLPLMPHADLMTDERWMRRALEEAERAAGLGEVPVGCVVVNADGTELARGHNLREAENDPTAHAEMIALRCAARARGSWRLEDATVYATLEPCPMCAGALVNARVGRVVWGCDDPKAGACRSLYSIGTDPRLNHRFEVTGGVLEAECAARLRRFFATLRATARNKEPA
jgi:tRNA(adenine34) deaminase